MFEESALHFLQLTRNEGPRRSRIALLWFSAASDPCQDRRHHRSRPDVRSRPAFTRALSGRRPHDDTLDESARKSRHRYWLLVSAYCPIWSKLMFADFYNYFQHGIDFLISGTTHAVKKIILHTNIVRLLVTLQFLLAH